MGVRKTIHENFWYQKCKYRFILTPIHYSFIPSLTLFCCSLRRWVDDRQRAKIIRKILSKAETPRREDFESQVVFTPLRQHGSASRFGREIKTSKRKLSPIWIVTRTLKVSGGVWNEWLSTRRQKGGEEKYLKVKLFITKRSFSDFNLPSKKCFSSLTWRRRARRKGKNLFFT